MFIFDNTMENYNVKINGNMFFSKVITVPLTNGMLVIIQPKNNYNEEHLTSDRSL